MANLPVVTPNPIPTFKQPITDDTDLTTRPWYFFFQSLYNNILKPTGVTPGSYTNTNLTVNANGVITAASNGSGGGVTQIIAGTNVTISPAGGAGVVTVNAAGGSANITPDTHPASPTNWDDEFEFGASIDTTGARRTGALPWTWTNQLTATAPVSQGALTINGSGTGGGRVQNIITESLSGIGSAWTFTCKFNLNNANGGGGNGGMILGNGSKYITFGIGASAANAIRFLSQRLTNPTTVASTIFAAPVPTPNVWVSTVSSNYIYLQIALASGLFSFNASITGVPGSFIQIGTESLVTFLTTVTDIGVQVDAEGSPTQSVFDWFRRTA